MVKKDNKNILRESNKGNLKRENGTFLKQKKRESF